jgi:hypothetical protein
VPGLSQAFQHIFGLELCGSGSRALLQPGLRGYPQLSLGFYSFT